MDYRNALYPWCIVRLLPKCQCIVVGRFRRCSAAENHLKLLNRLIPAGSFVVVFDPPEEKAEPKTEGGTKGRRQKVELKVEGRR